MERFKRRESGGILYNTGDRAYLIDKSTVVYVGRKDNQLKILGHRIELGELEKCIHGYPGITKSCLMVRNNHKQEQILCMYYIATQNIYEREIREYLSRYLPSYMIPTIYQKLVEMPITINGKIDYNKLPELVVDQIINKYDEMKGIYDSFLIILGEILNKPDIDYYDNFFYCGVDSIKAIQFISQLTKRDYKLSVSQILSNPIIGDMLRYIKDESNDIIKYQEAKGIQKQTYHELVYKAKLL